MPVACDPERSAAAALDQPHSDLTLERRNAAADRRLGHAKQARGSRETTRLDDTSEHHDIVEIKHLYPKLGRCFSNYRPLWINVASPNSSSEKTRGAVT